MIRLKSVVTGGFFLFVAWIGYSSFGYFFDTQAPMVTVHGIKDSFCAGDVQCSIMVDKPGDISILIDDAPVVDHAPLTEKNKLYAFTIPTRALEDGKHDVKVVCTDRSYNKNVTSVDAAFVVDNKPLQVAFTKESDFKVLQGRTLHVQFQVNKDIEQAQVKALAQTHPCFAQSEHANIYECYIPIACEEKPNEYLFSVEVTDKVGNKSMLDNTFNIVQCDFKKQTIKVDPDKLQKERERGKAMAQLEECLAALAKESPKEKMWRGSFCTPIDIDRVTCEYGTVRTTQERGRYAHKALDVINYPRSVVWATQDGVVALKDRFDFSGNTVVIDHGHGVLSLFYHLDDFADIEVGQKIAQGNPVGTLGKTGYATGYHLHWEMRVRNMQVDPMQWTEETF